MEKRVLIIEDDRAIAELERDYLEASDFIVDIEVDGARGLEAALKKDYSLVMIDIMLPTMDGFEICKKLRKEKNIPILTISARKDDVDKIRAFGLGSDDYIVKPFSPSELVARVKAHISRYEELVASESNENAAVTAGEIQIDPEPAGFSYAAKRFPLPIRSLTFFGFSLQIRIRFIQRKSFSAVFGAMIQ